MNYLKQTHWVRSVLALLFLFCCTTVQAQNNLPHHHCGDLDHHDQPLDDIHHNFEWQEDGEGGFTKKVTYKWFDRFGNRYADLRLQREAMPNLMDPHGTESNVPTHNYTTPDCQSSGGLFNLYFVDIQTGSGTGFDLAANAPMVEIICQVFSDIDALLVQSNSACGGSADPVNIEIRSINSPGSGILGSATSYYEFYGETTGIKHGEVWKAINTGQNDPNTWDGFININTAYNWFTGYTGTVPSGQVDLYSVMLHEAMHALGFASLIGQTGASKFAPTANNYSAFDEFLRLSTGTDLIANSGGYTWNYNTGSPATDLTSGCQNPSPTGPDVQFNGNVNTALSPVYAASTWSNGSSLSHFVIGCDGASTPQYIMNAGISPGVARRLTQQEVNTLCDLGYRTSGTYGTPTLTIGGGANPNVQSFTTCGSLFAATDDFGPCCTSNEFSVTLCSSATLNINASQLTCNDIGAGGTSIVDFEVISTGTLLPQSGSNFTFTPTQPGTEVLRYKLEDGSGNQSNYAYVFITVYPCPGFNCTNTDPCNLICNPIFDDGGSCSPSTTCRRQMSPGGSCPGGYAAVDGWYPCFGTADFFPSGCAGGGTYNNPTPITSDGHTFLWDGYGFQEGLMTAVPVQQNRNYILSYFREEGAGNAGASHTLRTNLTNLSEFTSHPNPPGSSSIGSNVPANRQIVFTETFTEAGDWEQSIVCFSSTDDWDILYFETITPNNNYISGVFMDQFELIEDLMQDIQTEFIVGCQQSVVIGEQLCDVTNMVYSWWDVTDAGSPVQLTDGTTVLAAGISAGVSIPVGNTNGSAMQVPVTSDKVYELRRRFVSSNGFAIANNSCDSEVQVNVILARDIEVEKVALNGPNIPNGGTVQYQINVTNGSGVPVTNLLVSDVLGPNFNTGSVSFTPNANVSFSQTGSLLEFTVLNLPDGDSETIEFSVQVTGNVGDTIENCASVEFLGCTYEDCTDIIIIDAPLCEVNANYYVAISIDNHCKYIFSDATTVGSNCTIIGWNWDFGDPASGANNTSTLQNPTHLFSSPGIYNVCLIVEVLCGETTCYDTICYRMPVECETEPCEADPQFYIAINEDRCTHYFTDASSVGPGCIITNWYWNFGDGTTSNMQNPVHSYTADGVYTVCLTITVQCKGGIICKKQICQTFPVEGCKKSCDVTPDFDYQVNADYPCTFNFTDLTVLGRGCNFVGWHWNFGDGNTSSLQNPTHTYTADGTYTVCLTVVAQCGQQWCKEKICYQVTVKGCEVECEVKPNFYVYTDASNGCLHYFYDLTNVGPGCNIVSYNWDFGDGTSSNLANPTHVFPANGTYLVCLTVVAQCGQQWCRERYCYKVTVNDCNPCPCGIKPNFSYSVNECTVQFQDLSLTNECTKITNWSWDFGDGTSSSAANPTHTYSSPGTYLVCLTITGNSGYEACKKKICYEVTVRECNEDCHCDIDPAFDFDINGCRVDFVDKTQLSADCDIIGWSWNFDDPASGTSNTSNAQYPTHIFTASGSYNVCLTVTYTDGQNVCTKEVCQYIDVSCSQDCHCEIDPTFKIELRPCAVDLTDYTYISDNCEILSRYWSFGDGNSAYGANVYHQYAGSGTYEICLTITYTDGEAICTVEICETVDIDCRKSAIAEPVEDVVLENMALSIYPNPFAGELFIDLDLVQEERVSIDVYDAFGKHIAQISDQQLVNSGKHTFKWNAGGKGVATGIYFVRIQSGEKEQYRKVIFK